MPKVSVIVVVEDARGIPAAVESAKQLRVLSVPALSPTLKTITSPKPPHKLSNTLRTLHQLSKTSIKHMKLYNRTRDKVDALLHEWKGSVGHSNNIVVDIVDSPIEASIGCDITMVCLGNEEICSDVLLGGGGGGGGL